MQDNNTAPASERAGRRRCISASVSRILVIAIFAALIAAVFLIPVLFRSYMNFYGKPESLFLPSMINLYTALMPAFVADICLYMLLRDIGRGEVFTDPNVARLRIISWCCFVECVVFFVFGFYFLISFAVSFACAFMGTVLRVVKNCIEQATEIKRENDFTI